MDSTPRVSTGAFERLAAGGVRGTPFDSSAAQGGGRFDAAELAQVIGATDKTLFCRLPRPLQLALKGAWQATSGQKETLVKVD